MFMLRMRTRPTGAIAAGRTDPAQPCGTFRNVRSRNPRAMSQMGPTAVIARDQHSPIGISCWQSGVTRPRCSPPSRSTRRDLPGAVEDLSRSCRKPVEELTRRVPAKVCADTVVMSGNLELLDLRWLCHVLGAVQYQRS